MNTDNPVLVTPADQVPAQQIPVGKNASMQVLIGPDRAPNFFLRRFTFGPGGGIPKHTNRVEHEQYVLRGRAKVGIGDAVYEVKSGDVVFIPKGIPHWYETQGDEPFEVLCSVPNQPDKMELLQDS
jgi:quercetin dioxygenase-like cupin family protein